jgi:hypothetical protein
MRRRSLPDAVKKFADEWRLYHVQGKSGGTHTVRETVRRHLDRMFNGALNAMLGVRQDSFHGVSILPQQKDGTPSVIETILAKHRGEMEKQLSELLKLAEFSFKPDELRKLRRCYREALMEKLEEKVRNKADEVAEAVVEHELRHLWMDEETVALVEGKLDQKAG